MLKVLFYQDRPRPIVNYAPDRWGRYSSSSSEYADKRLEAIKAPLDLITAYMVAEDKSSPQQIADKIAQRLTDSEGGLIETRAFVAYIRHYLALWVSDAFRRNPMTLQTDIYGETLQQLLQQLYDYYHRRNAYDTEQIRQNYMAGLAHAMQSGDPALKERFNQAYQQAWEEVHGPDRVAQFVKEMMELARLLEQYPVLVPSGQYEMTPRYGPQQTHIDRKGQRANELHSLPDLHALCAFQENGTPVEYTVRIPLPAAGVSHSELSQRLQLLDQQTLEAGYYRERAESHSDIHHRHTSLQQQAEIQQHPPHRNAASHQAGQPTTASQGSAPPQPGSAALPTSIGNAGSVSATTPVQRKRRRIN